MWVRRTYATARKNIVKSKKGGVQDPRHVLIKEMLYDKKVPSTDPKDFKPNIKPPSTKPSPVYIGQDPIEQEIDQVERMWYLIKHQEAQRQTTELKQVAMSMRAAMERLEQVDSRLFEDALKKEKVQLFPRKFRVPTESPSPLGWDYEINRHEN